MTAPITALMTALMAFAAFFIAACAVWWLAVLTLHVGSAAAACAMPLLRRQPPRRSDLPPLSVIVPVKEPTAGLEPGLVSLFSQSYPDFEVLIAATETDSAALELARSIAARYPRIRSRCIGGDPRAARNPKINNLATPIAAARHDTICVKDANIRLDPGQLEELAHRLCGDVGLVVAAPVGTAPANFAAEIECAFMNGYVARFLLAAATLGWGFGIGAATLFDRRDFNKAGGIAAIADAIGEDHALAKALGRIGKGTLIADRVVRQPLGRRQFSDIWKRQLRWAVCRRIEAPPAFYCELLVSGAICTIAGGIGAPALGFASLPAMATTVLLWLAAEMLLVAVKGWPISWRSPCATLCRLCLFPVLWVQALLTRRIFWGGTPIELRGK